MTRITALDVVDVRFPTSRQLDGSDAMNPEPDYSAAYVALRVVPDVGALAKELIWDGQLRWLGPEKGLMHMAIGAVVNAVWDLAAKRADRHVHHALLGTQPAQLAVPDQVAVDRARVGAQLLH